MKKLFLLMLLPLNIMAAGGGGACVFQLPDGTLDCYEFNNAGVNTQQNCYDIAETAGAVTIDNPENLALFNCSSWAIPNSDTSAIFFGGTGNCNDGNDACEVILPIELISFKVENKISYNELIWATNSEYNSDYFEVIRNGISIGYVDAAGTTNEAQYYSFNDEQPINGINIYTLIQIDIDGTETIYGPVSVDNSKGEIIKMVDLQGRDLDEYYTGIVIVYYENNITEKIFKK